jgi:hypothetical protein
MAGIRINKVLNKELTIPEYNKASVANLADFLDFISVSYYLSHRQDSKFWKDRKEQSFITERMKVWLDKSKDKLQPPDEHILFVNSSWISKLIGFNWFPTLSGGVTGEALVGIEDIRSYNYNKLISQKEYLDRFIYKE